MPVQMPTFQTSDPANTGSMAFLRALQSGLGSIGQYNQNQISGAQAQYAPQMAQADMALKQAQARFLPLQYLAAPLANPSVVAAMGGDQLHGLVNTMMGMLSNGGYNPNQSMGGSSYPGGTNGGYNFPSGGSTNNLTAPSNNSGGYNVPNYQGSMGSTGYTGNVGGSINSGNNNSGSLNYGSSNTPSPSASGSIANPAGSFAANAKSQIGAADTGANSQATINNNQWADRYDKISQGSNAANNLRNEAITFKNAYGQSVLKGPEIGKSDPGGLGGLLAQMFNHDPGIDQTMNNAANNMVASMASDGNYGRVAGPEINYLKSAKPSSTLTQSGVNNVTNQMFANADRANSKYNFYHNIQQNGGTAPMADILWNAYNQQMPPYDKNFNPNDFYNKEAWQNYTTKDAINSIANNKTFTPTNLKSLQNTQYNLLNKPISSVASQPQPNVQPAQSSALQGTTLGQYGSRAGNPNVGLINVNAPQAQPPMQQSPQPQQVQPQNIVPSNGLAYAGKKWHREPGTGRWVGAAY